MQIIYYRYLFLDQGIICSNIENNTYSNYASEIINITRTFSGLKNKKLDLNNPEVIKKAYREEVLILRQRDAWAGAWQFYQMANVVNRVVRGLHPRIYKVNKKGEASFDDSYHTRTNLERPFAYFGYDERTDHRLPLGIMWTKSNIADGPFNHFVPIVWYVFLRESRDSRMCCTFSISCRSFAAIDQIRCS